MLTHVQRLGPKLAEAKLETKIKLVVAYAIDSDVFAAYTNEVD